MEQQKIVRKVQPRKIMQTPKEEVLKEETTTEVCYEEEAEKYEEQDVDVYESTIIDPKRAKAPQTIEVGLVEDNPGQYFHQLKRAIDYNGVVFDSIHFDFEAMNGSDLLKVEEEMARKNKISVGVELSKVNQYLLAVCGANQCKEENGFVMTSDLLEQLPMSDFNAICNATRRFFTQ